MKALVGLTLANIRSIVRDRASLFWLLAFPLIFIVMFGLIFAESGSRGQFDVAWVDEDGSEASTGVRSAFDAVEFVTLTDLSRDEALDQMRAGDVDTVLVAPAGFGDAFAAAADGTGASASLIVFTDPSNESATASTLRLVDSILGVVNLGGRPPLVARELESVQTSELNFISYFVPSILGMSVMQLGIFSAIPLVADREQLILKRLAATPLRRWQLVVSNIATRLLLAIAQTVIIVAVGSVLFGVAISGSIAMTVGFVLLGAVVFLAIGYVLASFAKTEDSANGMASVVQFPMMFLSGTFFPIDQMPEVLRAVARFIPLTYLSDALRQVMVNGTPFAPLWVCAVVLVGWLIVCLGIAARRFQWQ
jgi:ABC-2 type transport system permease protein